MSSTESLRIDPNVAKADLARIPLTTRHREHGEFYSGMDSILYLFLDTDFTDDTDIKKIRF